MLDPQRMAEAKRLARRDTIINRVVLWAIILGVLAAFLVPMMLDFDGQGSRIDTTYDPAERYEPYGPLPPAGQP